MREATTIVMNREKRFSPGLRLRGYGRSYQIIMVSLIDYIIGEFQKIILFGSFNRSYCLGDSIDHIVW